jgi:hypothetical protein
MNILLLGAIAMASFVAGLFFLRFWKTSGDRFFLFFAIAFWIEAVSRTCLALVHPLPEDFPFFYAMRLLAFGLIFFAILDKNRPHSLP